MRLRLGIAVLMALTAGVASAQDPVTFSHDPIACVSANCGRALVQANVEASVPLKSVRVYFNNGSGDEYYIEMLHKGDWNFNAVLPATAEGTAEVAYRIVAVTEDGTEIDGPSHTVPVNADCADTPLTADQTDLSMNNALGLTSGAQSGQPSGFSCSGLIKTIGTDDVMADNSACEEVKLAKADPCLLSESFETEPVVAGMPRGRAAAWMAAGVAAGAGLAVLVDDKNDNRRPVSNARP